MRFLWLVTVIVTIGLSTSAMALDADDPSLVGVWLFDEGEGDEVADVVNGNDGLMITEDDFEWDEGKFGNAVVAFGGGSIDVPDSDSIASIEDGLTVAGWFRIDSDSDTGVRKNGAFLLEDQSNSEPVPDAFSFRVWTDQGITPGFYGTTELEQGEWYHIAGTYDAESGAVEMYVNGVPESSIEDGVLDSGGNVWEPVWGGSVSPGQTLQLKYGPEAYNGAIDEVVILNRAITQEEVLQLMNGWPFSQSTLGDFNNNGEIDAEDIDIIAAAIRDGSNDSKFDLNSDSKVDDSDRVSLVKDVRKTWIGDSNLDGEFNSSDFVQVFGAAKYEKDVMAGWAEGDWNGDGFFNSSDFVAAFTDGGYEKGPLPQAAAVPEPSTFVLILFGLLPLIRTRR